jgi:endonuclease/exonuclease/phosphatase family metal-dependent hydrolase
MSNEFFPLVGLFENPVDRMHSVSRASRQRIAALPLTHQSHLTAGAEIHALREIETSGAREPDIAPSLPLRVGAWNLERCLHPDAAARILRAHGVELALLTEMDVGMLRTSQRHTIARISEGLQQRYAFGLEFVELQPMPPPPGIPVHGSDNDAGFHGNGIVTALDFERPAVIRLPEVADWFTAPKNGQRRVGNRIGVAATFNVSGLRFVACAVHLESNSDGAARAAQMSALLDALDTYAPGLPVLVGGDLNTRVSAGRRDDPFEPLFVEPVRRGYDFSACNCVSPTTRRGTWSDGMGDQQLDWFLARGLKASDPEIVQALAQDGTVLSDHDLILTTIAAG